MIWTAITKSYTFYKDAEIFDAKVFSASHDCKLAWNSAKERYSENSEIIALIPGNHGGSIVADGDSFKRLDSTLLFDL